MNVPAIILTKDNQTREILKMYIDEFEAFSVLNTDDVYNELSKYDKSVLIADISEDTDRKLDFILNLTKEISGCKVLVLSDSPSVDLIVKAMRAGAREFLPLPLIKTEVFEAFTKLQESLTVAPKNGSKCKVFSIYSNKGGIGKTSIATNLAVELANITKEKVALIDLNFQLGDVTTFMDIQPSFNISYMLENLEKINEDFLLSTLERYKNTSLYVLADPPYFKQAQDISPKQITKLFNILKNTFSYIVIDAESSFDAKNIAALTESDMIFLVTVANLPAIRNIQRCVELFTKLGFDENKIHILLNRFMENDEISVKDIENTIGKKVFWKVPNNYITMMSSINKGIPVSIMNPDSNVAKNYRDLVFRLTDRIYREDLSKKYEKVLGGTYGS